MLLAVMLSIKCLAIDEFKRNPSCDGSQREMSQCASKRLEFYDKTLNVLYNKQISFLGENTERANALKEAQKSWIKFRDLDCAYKAGKRENSGSMWLLTHLYCMGDKTRNRALELEAYVACRENGCPTGDT